MKMNLFPWLARINKRPLKRWVLTGVAGVMKIPFQTPTTMFKKTIETVSRLFKAGRVAPISPVRALPVRFPVIAAIAAAFLCAALPTAADEHEDRVQAAEKRLREQIPNFDTLPEELKKTLREMALAPVAPPRREPTPEELAEMRQRAAVRAEERVREREARRAEIQRTVRPTFPAGELEPDFLRHDNAEWRARLEARRNQAIANRGQIEAELDAIAARHGIGRSGRDEQGRGWTLVGESAGHPILMTTQNARATASIYASDLWPSGLHSWQNPLLSRNLTGTGVTTGIWEAGPAPGIRTSHLEFGSRAVQVDSATPGDHGTAVAGAIAGGGNLDVIVGGNNLGRMLRGVAYQSQVLGHSLDGFPQRMENAVLGGQRFSNHSYGIGGGGWGVALYQGSYWWYWPHPEFAREPRFGAYSSPVASGISSANLDAFVFDSEIQLPVYAAGNPDNLYGPGEFTWHLIVENGQPVFSNAERAWFNGGAVGEVRTAQSKAYNTVASPSTAKNVLSVGSIQDRIGSNVIRSSFSGIGPTDDGRIKPDLVAVGERNPALGWGNSLFLPRAGSDTDYHGSAANLQGTSFAAPQVTGALALAQQRRQQLYPGAGPWLASTWRALTIHTAEDIGDPGPDYQMGWGVFDAVALVEQIEADAALGRGSLVREFTITQGQPKFFSVSLPADTAANFTLTWTDLPGSPATFPEALDDDTPMLVNDIDLLVEDINTDDKHYPWILDPDLADHSQEKLGAPAINTVIGEAVPRDDRNNVERIDITPVSHERRLRVTVSPYGAIQGGSQKVSLVLGGVVPDGPEIKAFASTENPANPHEMHLTFTSDPGAYYTMESSTNLETGSWSAVDTVIAEDDVTTVLLSRSPAEGRRFWRIKRGE